MPETEQSIAQLRLVQNQAQAAPKQKIYPLSSGSSAVLGRDFRCQIVLDPTLYRSVSRRHIEISSLSGILTPDGLPVWQVCDLNSRNGTFVNGERLQGCKVLSMGDRIALGQNGPEFVFEYQPNSTPEITFRSSPAPLSIPDLYPTAPPPSRPMVPRSPESVSMTQLFPILSTGRELARKAYLLPAGITILCVVLLFLSIGNSIAFNFLLASYLAGAAYYFIYQLCGKRKPWWIVAAMMATTALLIMSPALELFVFIFHRVLPGNLANTTAQTNPFILLIKMFFGAGLMEEVLKAMPVLLAAWVGTRLRSPLRQKVGVWEPLDGILLGAAAAVGFSLMETLGVYIPATYKSALTQVGQEAAQLAGLQLLIPRVLGLVAGHMAYSGYFGYFIGLSMLRRRQRKLILLVGLLTAAILHTLWNAAGMLNPVFLTLIGGVSYAFLGAAILKARSLSPTRSQNFATRFMHKSGQ
ncbi:MAG: PrsW family glutamic-type intramembrane protease [Leptolyngbyaceae cyanobacterium bins.302]|nr:PrsW family glutamic-type intramembrane protease [Leptolyngbyaceae cyanobacterium bins.302]